MRKRAYGFTLIEVALFLAVTGILFVAITVGVQNSIYQQRYNDTVQNYSNFLQNLYSEVANVQSVGNGRHEVAIYGKLVTFGESGANGDKQTINIYNVIADAVNSSEITASNDTLGLLKGLHANVVRKNESGVFETVGIVETYTPKWAARIQNTDDFEDYVGALLIVRHAKSGMIRTFVMDSETIEVETIINNALGDSVNVFEYGDGVNYLDSFDIQQVDYCVNPNGDEQSGNRTDVRIVSGASDASGVVIIPLDDEENECNK